MVQQMHSTHAISTTGTHHHRCHFQNSPPLTPSPLLPPHAQLVPYDMSLASVKKFIWRRSEDVLFTFSARDPANVPPLPVLSPPS
jgi:hypothetical protein